MSKIAPRICPCGCGSQLARSRMVCAVQWSRTPVDVRAAASAPAYDEQSLGEKRAATRELLELAKERAANGVQLNLFEKR